MTQSGPARLALGTVQFGLRYGIANTLGQVDRNAAGVILATAAGHGIDTLDTAIAYGESEECLGKIGVSGWHVVTKLPEMPAGTDPADWAQTALAGSLRRLGLPRVKGLLLHRPLQLLGPGGDVLWQTLQGFKARGLVDQVGFSIYGPDELDALADAFPPDLVQSPFNILDRRLVTSGWLEKLTAAGTEVHCRSVFLQGLLLMNAQNRPSRFDRWAGTWSAFQEWLDVSKLSALEACLAFALSEQRLARVVVGVDSPSQFEEICAAANTQLPIPVPDTLDVADVDLLNPARWNALL